MKIGFPKLQHLGSRLWTVFQFVSAQGITMAANLLYGLLCVRLLPSGEYAKFVLVFGVQGTLLILMDANFSGTLIPLIGERVDNKKLIADYVASLRQLSVWAYALVGSLAIIFYPLLVKNRHWSWQTIAGMIVILLLSTWFMRVAAAYGSVVILLRDRATFYKGQLISSVGTLALLLACYELGWLGPFQAMIINVIGMMVVAAMAYQRCNTLLGVKGVVAPEKKKAIIQLALPNMPQAVFFALQGQISLFLITYFGHTKGLASVGALGRVGQIFAIFLQANGLLVEPYFAKLPKEKLKRSYLLATLMAAVISISVMLVALKVPQLLLWVLGPQYSDLAFEVKLAVAASAVSCFSGVLWGIHSARRFVFWWNVISNIALTLAVQVVFFIKVDVGTVRGVLWLNLATNVASLLINVLSGVYGFIKGPREVEVTTPPDQPQIAFEAETAVAIYELEHADAPFHAMPVLDRANDVNQQD